MGGDLDGGCHVSGVAALVWSKYPTLGVAGIRDAMLGGVDAKPSFAGRLVRGGRLNARRALTEASKMVPGVKLSRTDSSGGLPQGLGRGLRALQKTCAMIATGGLPPAASPVRHHSRR